MQLLPHHTNRVAAIANHQQSKRQQCRILLAASSSWCWCAMHSDLQTVNDENESRLCVMLALCQQAYLILNKHWHIDQHPDISARHFRLSPCVGVFALAACWQSV